MSEGSIKSSSAIKIVVPGHRVIFTIAAPGITAFIDSNQHVQIGTNPFEVIEFIKTLPNFWEVSSRNMVCIHDIENCFLWSRVAFKISAGQFSKPGPVVLGIRRRMKAYITTPVSNKLL